MEEKTEQPSQRKLKKARERGEFVVSSELTSSLILAGGLLLLWAFSTVLNGSLQGIFTEVFYELHTLDPEEGLKRVVLRVILPVSTFLLCLFGLALISKWVQTGWVWGRKKRRGKAQSHIFFTLLKVAVIGAIGYLTLKGVRPSLQPPSIFEMLFFLLIKVALALVVLGLGDFIYQKWKFYQSMRMTKQELKDEQREAEGDRQSKSKMRKR